MALDDILKKIREQAGLEAANILAEAESGVGEIEGKGGESLERMEGETKRKEAAIEAELMNAILLPARLKIRGVKLATKQELIGRVFREAMEFDDADYKKVLGHLFSQIPEVSGGVLYPAEGKERITEEFLREKEIDVKLGEPVPGIMGGFLLRAGKIEYDGSFTTLLKKLKEKLETEVAPLFVSRIS